MNACSFRQPIHNEQRIAKCRKFNFVQNLVHSHPTECWNDGILEQWNVGLSTVGSSVIAAWRRPAAPQFIIFYKGQKSLNCLTPNIPTFHNSNIPRDGLVYPNGVVEGSPGFPAEGYPGNDPQTRTKPQRGFGVNSRSRSSDSATPLGLNTSFDAIPGVAPRATPGYPPQPRWGRLGVVLST